MRVWGNIRKDTHIRAEVVQEFAMARDMADWDTVLCSLCHALDLARPVILPRHIQHLQRFSRTVFKPDDFIEPVDFDHFEVVIFPEEKKPR